ncbi:MAG TPA: response regulator [Acidobacteriaceae bacterium]|nr:response regulator [Acidobacteriaceae bacterium]
MVTIKRLTAMTADILLVDDNAIQATTRRSILLRTGRTVAVALEPLEALDMLKDDELVDSIGLVITDHYMPGMQGPEFVAEIRRVLPSVPVLVLSGFSDVEHEYEGLNILFRMKPIAPEQLIAMAKTLLDPPLTRTA